MSKGDKKGFSKEDNEAAGRLLMMGGVAIIAVIFLLISPLLIGGVLVGLTWYGAYVEDGDKNGERLIWPILITLFIFIYL